MNTEFRQNALRNGEEGKRWLESIPDLIEQYQQKWSLRVFPPFELNYNYVAPAIRADGTEAVLKFGFPGDREFQTEIEALLLCKGEGMVKIMELDAANAVILLEKVMPGEPLSALDDDEEATRILAGVMKKIIKPLPEKHNFIRLEDWSAGLSRFKQRYRSAASPLPMRLVEKADRLFQELSAAAEPAMMLHGDLHHDNVLSSKGVGWLAIDPKGIAAEPAYEAAAMIRNPYEKLRHIPDLEPLLRRRLIIFSEELGVDYERLHGWCLAQTILSAVWNVEEAKGVDHALRVAEVLERMEF